MCADDVVCWSLGVNELRTFLKFPTAGIGPYLVHLNRLMPNAHTPSHCQLKKTTFASQCVSKEKSLLGNQIYKSFVSKTNYNFREDRAVRWEARETKANHLLWLQFAEEILGQSWVAFFRQTITVTSSFAQCKIVSSPPLDNRTSCFYKCYDCCSKLCYCCLVVDSRILHRLWAPTVVMIQVLMQCSPSRVWPEVWFSGENSSPTQQFLRRIGRKRLCHQGDRMDNKSGFAPVRIRLR
jgi:hypothetical protein